MRKTFTDTGDFEACRAAEQWLDERGFSVGRMQGPDSRGIRHGDCDIAKWRNLSAEDRDRMHGRMTGNMRNGPVHVSISDDVLRTYEVVL